MSSLFTNFPQIGDRVFSIYSFHRISTLVTCIESQGSQPTKFQNLTGLAVFKLPASFAFTMNHPFLYDVFSPYPHLDPVNCTLAEFTVNVQNIININDRQTLHRQPTNGQPALISMAHNNHLAQNRDIHLAQAWCRRLQQKVTPRQSGRRICFAAHGGGSIDELSGRTTGRIGYIGPTTTHAIGGTAELALRYSIISASSAGPSRFEERLRAGRGCGSMGQRRHFRRGCRTFQGLRAGQEPPTPPQTPPGPQYLSGTTGRMERRTD